MFTTNYLAKLGVAVLIGTDDVDLSQVAAAAFKWRNHGSFDPDIPVVWDLVAAEIHFDWQTIKDSIPSIAERIDGTRSKGAKTAWVVSNEVTEMIVDSVNMAYSWTTQWQVFYDAETAIEWAISE